MRSELFSESLDATSTSVTCTFDPPRARVRLHGTFDLTSRDHLADVLECLRLRGCTIVELDTQHLTSVDACCLRVLYNEMHLLTRAQGALLLVAASRAFVDAVDSVGYPDFSHQPTVPAPSHQGSSLRLEGRRLGDTSASGAGQRRRDASARIDWTPT